MLTRRQFIQSSILTGIFVSIPVSVKKVVAQVCGQSCLPACLPMALESPWRDEILNSFHEDEPTGIKLTRFEAKEITFWDRLIGVFNK